MTNRINTPDTVDNITCRFVDYQSVTTFQDQMDALESSITSGNVLFTESIEDSLDFIIPDLAPLFGHTPVYIRSLFIRNHHGMYDINELELLFSSRGYNLKIEMQIESIVTEYTTATITISPQDDPTIVLEQHTVLTSCIAPLVCSMILNATITDKVVDIPDDLD